MAGINKWLGIGNLTKDPEIRYSTSGTCICNFSIACNETWKDKDGQKQEKVEYINIVVFKRLAEICGEYLSKGQQIYIEGKLQTRSWDDKDGVKKWITEVVANQMQMLGSKKEKESKPKDEGMPKDLPFDDSDIPF